MPASKATPTDTDTQDKPKSRHQPDWESKTLLFLIIAASLAVVLAMAAGLLLRPESLVKEELYQAVFLTNGQTYFGKLASADDTYVVLRDVYYIQGSDQVQVPNEPTPTQNLVLKKLGNTELHGPENEMFISRDHVLFWENLKDSSEIVQTIKGN